MFKGSFCACARVLAYFSLLPTGKGPGVVTDPFERNWTCWTAYGVDRPSIKNGLELLQGAGFCDASLEFIPVPRGLEEERFEKDIAVDSFGRALSGLWFFYHLVLSSKSF